MIAILAVLAAQDRVSDSFTPSGQLLAPAGKPALIAGRPVDLAVSGDGQYVLVKENRGITVLRASDMTQAGEIRLATGASMTGLLCTPSGQVFFSDARDTVHEGVLKADGAIDWARSLTLPKPAVGGAAYPCGIATTPTGLAVCASRSNTLVLFDKEGAATSIDVDPCPYDVTIQGNKAWVTCWGRKPGKRSGKSSGTDVDVDDRGVATGGMLDEIDLDTKKVVNRLKTGLQPSQVLATADHVYVACANSDTVESFDLKYLRMDAEVVVKPDEKLPFGSAPNAMALSPDGKELYVACGGDNAVAVLSTNPLNRKGWIPSGWYPGAVAISGGKLYVASIKGIGARSGKADKHSVFDYSGLVSQIDLPSEDALANYTAKAVELIDAPQILENMALQHLISGMPEPLPSRLGVTSPIQHIVYVIKENRTYDQVLGDIGKGASEPKLTIYGADTTPNQHALAREFVLLDNFYCNGTVSADGHSWLTQANASSYFERTFGGWTRSYPFGGDDALANYVAGHIWDAVLAAGKSFRNYGEGDYAGVDKQSWTQIYAATKTGQTLTFKQDIANDRLRRYSSRDYPGWNLAINDQYRANVFLRDLKGFEAKNSMPNLMTVYLEQDHTAGLTVGMPTTKAMVADNDLAVGRIVEGLSHSKFWPSTAIFIIEDDAQDGFDHIDGHRSTCYVVSPYVHRGLLVSNFYNQTSVVHTMLQILGVPPLNEFDARSPLMSDCFMDKPNLTPYTVKPNQIPLDQMNVAKKMSSLQKQWAAKCAKLDFSKPDAANEDILNRAQWIAVKGSRRYPGKNDE